MDLWNDRPFQVPFSSPCYTLKFWNSDYQNFCIVPSNLLVPVFPGDTTVLKMIVGESARGEHRSSARAKHTYGVRS
jgi:hypothetical protein